MSTKRKSGATGNESHEGIKKPKANEQFKLQEKNKMDYPRLDETKKTELNDIFEEMHTKVSINYSQREVQEIQTAVQTMLDRVVARVNERGIFKISRIEPCGSMVEKTAVWKYRKTTRDRFTEFDYLGILDIPRDIVRRDEGCGQCVGLSILPMTTNGSNDRQNFSSVTLLPDRNRCDFMFWKEVNVCLGTSCDCFSVDVDDEIYQSLTYTLASKCDPNYRCDECVVEMPTGILRVNDSISVGRITESSLAFSWMSKGDTLSAYDRMLQEGAEKITSLPIHVDFLPAIEEPQTKLDDAYRHNVLLVPKRCNVCNRYDYWRKSCNLLEIVYMVNEVSAKHRKCYKIIKYLLSLQEYQSFSGYFLKTAALNHSRECSDSSEGCAECVLKILTELKHAYETETLNLFHDSGVNIYRAEYWRTNSLPFIQKAITKLLSKTTDSCQAFLQN